MSSLIYIAADAPLREIRNPYYKTVQMSVKEALDAGIEVPAYLLGDGSDLDKPLGLMLYDRTVPDGVCDKADDGGPDGDFEVIPIEKTGEMHTQKQFCASLEGEWYAHGCVDQVIEYIKEQLAHVAEVEIWHIWMGDYYPPQIKKVKLYADELDARVLREIEGLDLWQEKNLTAHCGHIPGSWGITEELEELASTAAHYCYTVMRR